MKAITGVFQGVSGALAAVGRLKPLIGENHINVLAPGSTHDEVQAVPHAEDMPPVGRTLGAALGAALGIGAGYTLPALLLPGIGPVVALGAVAAACLGALGGVAGWKVGDQADRDSFEGIPADELFVYEDALRQGRTVVIANVEDERLDRQVERVLREEGAESLDAARRAWWGWIRSQEEQHYQLHPSDFEREEELFRKGYEAAQRPSHRGRTFDDCLHDLRVQHPLEVGRAAYRRGFERGQAHLRRR